MKLIEHLSGFSVDDLRELARRRGLLLRQDALRDRQTLLRTLSGALGSYDGAHTAISGLNQAELATLAVLLRSGKRASLATLSAALNVDAAQLRPILDSLRLWGLVFPEGSWEHIGVPASTLALEPYLVVSLDGKTPPFQPRPALEPAPAEALDARPGSLSWDVAEFLARVARSRFRLTQAGRINKRDLRSIEAGLTVSSPGYASFLYQLSIAAGLLLGTRNDLLAVSEAVDSCLGQEPEARSRDLLGLWTSLRGFPESANVEPEESDYVPLHTVRHRTTVMQLLKALEPGTAATVSSVAGALRWESPRSFEQWEGHRSPEVVAARVVRSLFWLGLARVDNPEKATRVSLSPLGHLLLAGRAEGPAVIPEEAQFFLQPNAETFCPPNIAPRTLFHLRRVTGEKKGGPAGVFPITQDSVRRALDLGSTGDEVIGFLETFSRTGVPDTVRKLVETVARQHGRIRLVPAEVVLVTDNPQLLEEVRSLKPLQPMLGRQLTERAVSLSEADAAEVLKRLRSRGYSPVDESLSTEAPPLPDGLSAAPPPAPVLPASNGYAPPGFLDWSSVSADPEPVSNGDTDAAGPVWGRADVVDLLEQAVSGQMVVEIEYMGRNRAKPTVRRICPLYLDDYHVEGYCQLRQDDRIFNLSGIRWARLTGEKFEFEHL